MQDFTGVPAAGGYCRALAQRLAREEREKTGDINPAYSALT